MAKTLTLQHPRWNEFAGDLSQAVLAKCCRHNHQHAVRIMAAMGNIDIPASIKYFASRGGFCDCEILFNVACSEEDAA